MSTTKKVPLGKVCEIIMGQSPPSEYYNKNKEGLPFFQGKTDFNEIYPTITTYCSKPQKVAEKNDILISVRAPVGPTNVATTKSCIGRGLAAIRAKGIDFKYTLFFLRFNENSLAGKGKGSTFEAINREDLESLEIPLPSLPIQQQIAARLEKADEIRRMRRYAIEMSERFLQEVFIDMFGDPVKNPKGWDVVEAGEIFHIQLGKMLDGKQRTGHNLRPYLRNTNVQWNKIDISDLKFMDFEETERNKFLLKRGDILVCEGGEVGRTAIWNNEFLECYYQKALHRLRPKNSNIDFFSEFFTIYMMIAIKKGLLEELSSQVTFTHFTAEKFNELLILNPDQGLLKEYKKFYSHIMNLISQQREALRQSELLFSALLNEAFSE